jgi:hypothetical protein
MVPSDRKSKELSEGKPLLHVTEEPKGISL